MEDSMRTTALFVLVHAYRNGEVCASAFATYIQALNKPAYGTGPYAHTLGEDGVEWVLGSFIKDY
jgi:hypothetical protein